MTLALLVVLGQIADGLAYQLAHGHGTELVPSSAILIDAFGPGTMLVVKMLAGLVLGAGSLVLVSRGRGTVAAWLAIIGFVGALTELGAIA